MIQENQGPRLVNVVSGSQADQEYWLDRLVKTRQDVFRTDGETMVVSSVEPTRKGNFFGSLHAWGEVKKALGAGPLPPVMLMNMVFGLGKRLSPFTQALANRKPAFPTPMRGAHGLYLTTADTASFSANLWLNHLESNGFRGVIVKWGDEAVIPGKSWGGDGEEYRLVDGIRFVWQTAPTHDLAREKEWVEFDAHTNHMTYQYTRQPLDSLTHRLSEREGDRCIGVNLGSLGISYRLIEIAQEVFQDEVLDASKWVDWDPYTWIALACRDEAEWKAEAAIEERLGVTGMGSLERRVPGFFQKIQQVRQVFNERHGRMPVVKVLDFGEPFWMDWGLHLSLRRSLDAMVSDSELGVISRELFNLPQTRDKNGNILLRSLVPPQADIRDSLLVDTIITDPATVVHTGMVIGGRHRKLEMPHGGSALFCATNEMQFNGPHAIAFRVIKDRLLLEEGDRAAHLYFPEGALELRTNESLLNYEGENYSQPVMGNLISFEEAARRMSVEDTRLVEMRWSRAWSSWLD
jgi:hypothetical protein